jgi:type I restriction enzyme, S subunit
VLPEFALLVFRRHMHAKRFKRESRITTNIAHLSAARLKTIEFPIPPLDEQRRLVAQADTLLDANRRVQAGILQARARGEALRRAVLSAAFAGGLTGRASDLDRLKELAAAGVSA